MSLGSSRRYGVRSNVSRTAQQPDYERLGTGAETEPPEFWTVEEVRSFLRLGRKTVYAMIKEGKIPGVKRFGRALRLHRATVRQWAIDERHTKRGRQA